MRTTTLLLCLAATLVATFAAPADQQPARFCTVSAPEEGKCHAMKTNFAERGLSPGIECQHGLDKYDCMQRIEDGQSDLLSTWSMDAYVAGKYHHMVPLLREKHTTEPGWSYAYYALAIVKKSDRSINSLEDLRGKRSCHTGVNRHVGWLYPMAQFISRGLITSGDCINNVANMASFFNQSCASGANNPIWDPEGEYSNLCALCGGEGDNFCSKNDPYASYTGSLKCLLDGRGDVAFVKDTTFAEVIRERPEVANQKDEYELLCLDGSRKPVDDVKECNWGTIPERVLMTSMQMSQERRQAIRTMFQTAVEDQSTFKLFESSTYQNSKNLLFHDNTLTLEDVGDKDDYEKYLGDYMKVRNHQYLCQVPAARWCTISQPEQRKCIRMRDALVARFLKPEVECVQAADTNECMKFIEEGKADLISLDSGDIYKGGKKHSLQVFMNENSGKGDAKYYAVAVVKKNNTDLSFTNLRGKKSCHTGIERTAGWNIPAGALLKSDQIASPADCNIAKAVGDFFSESCAPGALSQDFNPAGQNPDSLCSLCAGSGDDKCSRTEREPFYGYTGAFKCMATGAGDVAFVKHVTAVDNTDGHNEDAWAKDLHITDFELLCKDGSRKPATEYPDCNLAKVPSHAVATHSAKGDEDLKRYIRMLDLAQQYYGDQLAVNFQLFGTGPHPKDLLFSDSTTSLKKLPTDQRPYRNYLGVLADQLDKISIDSCQN